MSTFPETAVEQALSGVTTIEVDSEYSPDSQFICCGEPTIQKQVNYQLTVNAQVFIVQRVWVSACNKCNEYFFDAEVGDAILDNIFKIQHPGRAKWDALLNGKT